MHEVVFCLYALTLLPHNLDDALKKPAVRCRVAWQSRLKLGGSKASARPHHETSASGSSYSHHHIPGGDAGADT